LYEEGNVENSVEQILAALSPGHLREIILRISQGQAPDNREGVGIGPILDALTGVKDLGAGPEGWEAFLKLREAIKATVAQIPGMKYIEADS
jgi:hypothetical protein